jgi:hypothetical protein
VHAQAKGSLRRKYWTVRAAAENRAQRYRLLARLPRGGTVAEVGTWQGDFAASILRWRRPVRLLLIDPWQYFADEGHAEAIYGGLANGQAEMDRIYHDVLNSFKGGISAGRVVVLRELSGEAAKGLDASRWIGSTLTLTIAMAPFKPTYRFTGLSSSLEAPWQATTTTRRGGGMAALHGQWTSSSSLTDSI